MAASAARLEQRQHATGTAGGLTVRAAVDAFLDSPKINRSPHTRRAYANVLDRTADVLGAAGMWRAVDLRGVQEGIDRGPDGQPAGRAGRVLALLESRSRRRHGHPSTDLPDNVHEWRDDRGRVTAGHWSRMWITLPDNGPLSDVVVRTTPCAGQGGVHRPEHQVELAGSWPSSSTSSPSSPAASTKAARRDTITGSTRPLIRDINVCSACRSPDPMIRPTRSGVGGSIPSARQCRSSSSRTRSGWRSLRHTCSASHAVSLSASATVHSRNPRNVRIWARWYSKVRPLHS